MQLQGLARMDDRVSRIVAALEAHDVIEVVGDQIGDLTLAFVAPLGADQHDTRHVMSSSVCSVPRTLAAAPGPGASPSQATHARILPHSGCVGKYD